MQHIGMGASQASAAIDGVLANIGSLDHTRQVGVLVSSYLRFPKRVNTCIECHPDIKEELHCLALQRLHSFTRGRDCGISQQVSCMIHYMMDRRNPFQSDGT